ncbi:RNI-like protein [Pholiota molesta]|nr:RNI-like protein [Pholiota molesta]
MTLGLKEPRNYPPAWYTVAKPLALSPTVAAHTVTAPNPSPFGTLRCKGRSKSSPYPISALDFVPITSSDIFQPLPIVVVNYFDRVLPRELRLRILAALVELHEQDHARAIAEGRWTMAKATSSKGRWVGRDKGIRELFKLSRVSKGWQALVFDGALWTDIDFHSFPDFLRVFSSDWCKPLEVPEAPVSYTQLTNINLQGCTYLTTRSIHHLLVRCKSLRVLSLKGLATVTNTTCDIIANFCAALTSLNLSRCPNVDGHGVSALTVFALMRKEHLPLKELRISGLKYITDGMMQSLGKAMPHLEVLDLSYARHLHNSALEAFVACDLDIEKSPHALETVVVSARDLGREANESGKFRRRVTKLRHLVLSSCFMLTDTACANLAYSVPKLEFLELAGLGADLKDDGLISLLRTTPNIRRLDLEDASGISDFLLEALTPDPPSTTPQGGSAIPKQPGHALEYLNLSYASSVNDDALIALIRNCPRLTGLELDNTRVGPDVLREFVKLSRERKLSNARIVAVDCRGISEGVVKELAPHTRPRLGWRAHGARKLLYLDARDGHEEELKLGQDECDAARVVLKTFYSWQTVNAVQAAKEKRRLKAASRRTASEESVEAGSNEDEAGTTFRRSARWWSPGGRRTTLPTIVRGRNTPPTITQDLNNDGCRAM